MTISICLSTTAYATIIDDIAAVYKEEPTPTKFFRLENKKQEAYLTTIISNMNLSKDQDIIIVHDSFINHGHGKRILSIINDTTKQNIILLDFKKKQLQNQDLKIISEENLNFELFLSLISKKYSNQKIIISMSNTLLYTKEKNEKLRDRYGVMDLLYYNLNFVKLVQDLNNVFLNKGMGNPDTRYVEKYLSSMLKNRKNQYDFINAIDDDVDHIVWDSKSENKEQKIKFRITNELIKYKEHNPKNIDDFIKAYIEHKKYMKDEYLDTYSLLASLKYMKGLYPNYDFYEKISIVKSITPAEFRLNVIDAYNNQVKLPKGIMTYAINLHKSLSIKDASDVETFIKFQEYSNRYESKYPFLFRGAYDIGMGYQITEHTTTRLHGFSVKYTDIYYGTSISTALKTYVDQLE